MIVTPTNPKNSRYIICNNKVSIAPPRFLTDELCICKAATHSAYLIFYAIKYIIFITKNQANIQIFCKNCKILFGMRNMEGQMYKEIKLICNRIRKKGIDSENMSILFY